MDANNHSPTTILDNPAKKAMSANQTVAVIWVKQPLEKEKGYPKIASKNENNSPFQGNGLRARFQGF